MDSQLAAHIRFVLDNRCIFIIILEFSTDDSDFTNGHRLRKKGGKT